MFETDENVSKYLQQLKLVCLANKGEFRNGLKFMSTNSAILQTPNNLFIEAYFLYKVGKYTEALAIIQKQDGKEYK